MFCYKVTKACVFEEDKKEVKTDQAQIARADIMPAPRNKKQ